MHGVNLGGWLVVEKWMTPALFAGTDAVDEYTLSQEPDGKNRLEKHRQEFITESDFAWLHKQGVNLVRIPVGYWLFEPIDGYIPTVQYLDHAIRWAEKHDIQVLIDLHGARGSQNGKDHSGKVGRAAWFENKAYQTETIEMLARIAERYKNSSALWGIELLNEPMPPLQHYFTLLRFYRRAYRKLVGILRPGTRVVHHDAFMPLLYTGALWGRSKYPVVMDMHLYGFDSRAKTVDVFLRRAVRIRKALLHTARLWQPVILGEWSTVLPRKFTENMTNDEREQITKHYAALQQELYGKHANGWTYWNYKTANGGTWNFRDLIQRGIIKI